MSKLNMFNLEIKDKQKNLILHIQGGLMQMPMDPTTPDEDIVKKSNDIIEYLCHVVSQMKETTKTISEEGCGTLT